METFLNRAKQLGLDLNRLKSGEGVDQLVTVENIEQLKAFLTDHRRELYAARKGAKGVERPVRTIADKAHDYVFSSTPLSDDDRVFLKHCFPMNVRVVAAENKTIKAGTVWDLGTSASPVTVNLGTLTLEPGASIKIANTVLDFTVQKLVKVSGSGPSSANYDLGIFGVTGVTPVQALKGENGGSGNDGIKGTCCSGGGIAGDDGKPGTNGNHGGKGSTGTMGNDGLPSLEATIVIGHIEGASFAISTRPGDGSQGGRGGDGGDGGRGGNGGDGVWCGCEFTHGGEGGNGGDGGLGGNGGQGGKGVPGNKITVQVPAGEGQKVKVTRMDANPGIAGQPGQGGAPGAGGSGGNGGHRSGCPCGNNGKGGNAGKAGDAGDGGKAGELSGAAGMVYVVEI